MICISSGHNVYINGMFDGGAWNASLGLAESDLAKQVVKELSTLFMSHGQAFKDVTPYSEKFNHSRTAHQERANRVNAINPKLYLDIHLNAGGGTGVECWVHNMGSSSVSHATKICENISNELGLRNRGVKAKSDFWSVSMVRCPAIIVECAFVDSNKDMSVFVPYKVARAIFEAVTGIKVNSHSSDNVGLTDIKLNINGQSQVIQGFYVNGTNYVPVRILEQFGYTLDWVNNEVVVK